MRYTRIIVMHYGGPDALTVAEEECPEPKRGEVRMKVLAAGVILPDLLAGENKGDVREARGVMVDFFAIVNHGPASAIPPGRSLTECVNDNVT